jgi:hypothetical protein
MQERQIGTVTHEVVYMSTSNKHAYTCALLGQDDVDEEA